MASCSTWLQFRLRVNGTLRTRSKTSSVRFVSTTDLLSIRVLSERWEHGSLNLLSLLPKSFQFIYRRRIERLPLVVQRVFNVPKAPAKLAVRQLQLCFRFDLQ